MTPPIRKTITNLTHQLALSGADLFLSTPTKPTNAATPVHSCVKLLCAHLDLSVSFAPSSATLSPLPNRPTVSSWCPWNRVALRCFKNAGSLPLPAMTCVSWLCPMSSFLSVCTSVHFLLFLVTPASQALAFGNSVLSASTKKYDLFGTTCQGLAEKKHRYPLYVISNGTGSTLSLARSPQGEPTKLKDVQGLFPSPQAFVFGAIEEDVLTQHPVNQVFERNRCSQSHTRVWVKFLDTDEGLSSLALVQDQRKCCSAMNLLSCARGRACCNDVALGNGHTPMFRHVGKTPASCNSERQLRVFKLRCATHSLTLNSGVSKVSRASSSGVCEAVGNDSTSGAGGIGVEP